MKKYEAIMTEVCCDAAYYYKVTRNNIRIYRIEKKLTQQDLADLCGLSRGYICDIENDLKHKHFSIATLSKISCALECSIYLFFK